MQQMGLGCIKKAIELKPDYAEAKAALENAGAPSAAAPAAPAAPVAAPAPAPAPAAKAQAPPKAPEAQAPNGFEWGETY